MYQCTQLGITSIKFTTQFNSHIYTWSRGLRLSKVCVDASITLTRNYQLTSQGTQAVTHYETNLFVMLLHYALVTSVSCRSYFTLPLFYLSNIHIIEQDT